MSLNEMQKQVDEWINQYKIGYFKPLEILARLTEESGEVARELNCLYGPKKKKPTEDKGDLEEEIGDILFTITCLANSQNLNLDKAFSRAMDKCYGRDKDRWEKTPTNWKANSFQLIEEAKSFTDLKDIALKVIKDMPPDAGQVCGPISTGGKGSIEENLKIVHNVIEKLDKQGKNIFNQMPFEDVMQVIKPQTNLSTKEANQKLLDDFYLPIFQSRLIKTLYFIHDWKSSHGAQWEHDKAKELGIEIIYLPEDFLEN